MPFIKVLCATALIFMPVLISQAKEKEPTKNMMDKVDKMIQSDSFKSQVSSPFTMPKNEDKDGLAKGTIPAPTSYNSQAQAIAEKTAAIVELEKQRMAKNGDLERFSEKNLADQVKKNENAAKLIAKDSMGSLSNTLTEKFGFEAGLASAFSNQPKPEDQLVKGIFISFSMTDAQILEAMKAAVRDGSQLYLNGLKKGHQGMHDTIRKLQLIGMKLPVKPDVRFQPKKFERFDIKVAPTMIYATPEKTVLVEGMLNMQWLQNKHESEGVEGNLGNYGAVFAVEEESIIETFRKRMESHDWAGKKEKAIDGYWAKQSFNTLPRATKAQTWYIDPTVRVQKNISNPQGQLLASAGDVVNPVKSAPIPLTIYAFDPTDTDQLQWAHNRVNSDNNNGQVMLMFSKIDSDKGWDHLAALRKHFKREMYQLPKELIKKFDLKALPVKVTTIVDKGVLKVEQVYLGEEE
ncbi:MAG: conjugal transfer pilus assembly protein TraW [Oleiphilaceae bacterium]|jgi:conjugal transfer pilus assembly protein TraW